MVDRNAYTEAAKSIERWQARTDGRVITEDMLPSPSKVGPPTAVWVVRDANLTDHAHPQVEVHTEAPRHGGRAPIRICQGMTEIAIAPDGLQNLIDALSAARVWVD